MHDILMLSIISDFSGLLTKERFRIFFRTNHFVSFTIKGLDLIYNSIGFVKLESISRFCSALLFFTHYFLLSMC